MHTLLVIERSDGSRLMVGGGDERFVVTLDGGKRNLVLHNQMGREGMTVEVCAGGQYGEYPETICVTRRKAAAVIDLFFDGNEVKADWV